ncbi:hypothetical protein RCXUPER_237 [Rhodobacter phage RcXuper]|nr:hypothetical protein RCXUPER_237 [Rhodobacter phage RcXuper]
MIKFVFLLTMFSETGTADVYVMDSNLTGEDCIAAVENYMATAPNMSRGLPSCEVDMAEAFTVNHKGEELTLPACETEDSDNCLWDGMQHGNGKGRTFYVLAGEVFYID